MGLFSSCEKRYLEILFSRLYSPHVDNISSRYNQLLKFIISISKTMAPEASTKTSLPEVLEIYDQEFVDQVLQKTLTWGKYKGHTYKWILENDIDYFIWAANTHLSNLGYTKTFGVMKQSILEVLPELDMKTTFTYGKYKGKRINKIYKEDPAYVKWLYQKRQVERHLSMDTRVMEFILNIKTIQKPTSSA